MSQAAMDSEVLLWFVVALTLLLLALIGATVWAHPGTAASPHPARCPHESSRAARSQAAGPGPTARQAAAALTELAQAGAGRPDPLLGQAGIALELAETGPVIARIPGPTVRTA